MLTTTRSSSKKNTKQQSSRRSFFFHHSFSKNSRSHQFSHWKKKEKKKKKKKKKNFAPLKKRRCQNFEKKRTKKMKTMKSENLHLSAFVLTEKRRLRALFIKRRNSSVQRFCLFFCLRKKSDERERKKGLCVVLCVRIEFNWLLFDLRFRVF